MCERECVCEVCGDAIVCVCVSYTRTCVTRHIHSLNTFPSFHARHVTAAVLKTVLVRRTRTHTHTLLQLYSNTQLHRTRCTVYH